MKLCFCNINTYLNTKNYVITWSKKITSYFHFIDFSNLYVFLKRLLVLTLKSLNCPFRNYLTLKDCIKLKQNRSFLPHLGNFVLYLGYLFKVSKSHSDFTCFGLKLVAGDNDLFSFCTQTPLLIIWKVFFLLFAQAPLGNVSFSGRKPEFLPSFYHLKYIYPYFAFSNSNV